MDTISDTDDICPVGAIWGVTICGKRLRETPIKSENKKVPIVSDVLASVAGIVSNSLRKNKE